MYTEFSALCDKKIELYLKKLEDSNYNHRDISSIGQFSHSDIRLYDLSNDPSEEHDLFTDEERYKDKAKEMYDYLGEQSREMAELIFFTGDDYRDVPSAYKTYTLDQKLEGMEDEQINKWKPWLDGYEINQ